MDPVGEVATDRRRAESSPFLEKDAIFPECLLCQLFENEIRVVGRFEKQISTLMRIIQLYLSLDRLIEHAPASEQAPSLSGQGLPISGSTRNDTLDPRVSSSPVTALHASSTSGKDWPEHVAEGLTAYHKTGSVEPPQESLWDQGRNLIPSKDDSSAPVDQDRLVRIVALMKQTFSQHEGSQNCVVCYSMKDLSASGELDLDRLKYNFEAATQSEKEIAVKIHVPPPDSRKRPRLEWTSIEKVDFVLEKHDSWSAIRLQEFRRDEKAPRVGPARPLLSTRLHVSALSRAFRTLTEVECDDQSRSDSSALLELETSTEPVVEI